ncbi:response regulator transcription factor [Nocardioides sp.]|uniref:response regulator n=1 Tax=Nocardioides sp. TaxID=35761 RepID=UPI0026108577|nr:response regulator transcription factor [Nocardioides sp.]
MNQAAVQAIQVFVLDDHDLVRRGVRSLLDSVDDLVLIGESGSAVEALEMIPRLKPDVVVLDHRLPDGSGIDVCREVRSADPEIAALILTSYDDDDALFAAIMAGASGYILKQVNGVDLVEVIRNVASGLAMLDPQVTAQVLERVRTGTAKGSPLDRLTANEQAVLDLIGQGMTNRQIARSLDLAEKTVKNYVSSILAKLELTSRTQAAILAHHEKG